MFPKYLSLGNNSSMAETLTEMDVLIVGGGVAGQRLGANKWFDPEVVGEETAAHMHGHIIDPNLPLQQFDDLNHMRSALDDGRLTIGEHVPAYRHFDVAYIASPTGKHMESLAEVNNLRAFHPNRHTSWTILEKPVVSGVYEEDLLRTMLSEGWIDPDRMYVHEPYLLSHGLQRMRSLIVEQRGVGNPPTDIRVWSNKDRTPDVARGRTGNEPQLGAFGVEFPHTHGAASLLAGVELGVQHVYDDRNIYYKNVDNNPLSEGTYTEFIHDDTVIRVAQGLGPFVMTSIGKMFSNPRPDITRAAEVTFADGRRTHLDLQPAVDRHALTKEHPYRHTIWTTYDAADSPKDQEFIPDYPIKTLITNVIDKLREPSTPLLQGVGIEVSLGRCVAIRELREQAQVQDGTVPEPN